MCLARGGKSRSQGELISFIHCKRNLHKMFVVVVDFVCGERGSSRGFHYRMLLFMGISLLGYDMYV